MQREINVIISRMVMMHRPPLQRISPVGDFYVQGRVTVPPEGGPTATVWQHHPSRARAWSFYHIGCNSTTSFMFYALSRDKAGRRGRRPLLLSDRSR